MNRATVGKRRERLLTKRLEDLVDEPRLGGPRKITHSQLEEAIMRTLEILPEEFESWGR